MFLGRLAVSGRKENIAFKRSRPPVTLPCQVVIGKWRGVQGDGGEHGRAALKVDYAHICCGERRQVHGVADRDSTNEPPNRTLVNRRVVIKRRPGDMDARLSIPGRTLARVLVGLVGTDFVGNDGDLLYDDVWRFSLPELQHHSCFEA